MPMYQSPSGQWSLGGRCPSGEENAQPCFRGDTALLSKGLLLQTRLSFEFSALIIDCLEDSSAGWCDDP